MKLTTLLFSVCFFHIAMGQTTMNVFQNNGSILFIPISSIDSVRFSTAPPPPKMNIYQSNNNILSLAIDDIDSITYTVPGQPPVLASLTTNTVVNITSSSATSGGYIINDGGATVTARGVCWSTSQFPTLVNNHTNNGTGSGEFISQISGLLPTTTYYLRAYATNSVGTSYGNQITFSTTNDANPSDTCIYNTTLPGTYTGIHEPNLTPAVVSFLESLIGEPLSDAVDTIIITMHPSDSNIIFFQSKLIEPILQGTRTGNNSFKIPKTSVTKANLLPPFVIDNASVRTLRDINIPCNIPDNNTILVELQIDGTSPGLPGTISFSTKPSFFIRL